MAPRESLLDVGVKQVWMMMQKWGRGRIEDEESQRKRTKYFQDVEVSFSVLFSTVVHLFFTYAAIYPVPLTFTLYPGGFDLSRKQTFSIVNSVFGALHAVAGYSIWSNRLGLLGTQDRA